MEPSRPSHTRHWLKPFRVWHARIGLGAALLMLLIAATGVLLNHKDVLFSKRPKQPKQRAAPRDRNSSDQVPRDTPTLSTNTTAAEWGAVLGDLADRAQERWGVQQIEQIELTADDGLVASRIKLRDGREARAIVTEGGWEFRGDYDRESTTTSGQPIARSTDWKKLIKDLHTGKVAGEWGKLVSDAAAIALILLTASGVYLWYKPKRLKRTQPSPRVAAPATKLRPTQRET